MVVLRTECERLVLIEEPGGGVADTGQTLGDRAVVAASHDAGDLREFGGSAAKQNDDFAFAGVEQGEEVVEHQPVDDLGFGALNGNGVGELDEPDLDLGAFAVKLAFEVLACVGPVV
ncbi:hypothetical protein [Mycolicibacterium gilvum]|uniref:hypothetical protein n=1 Tax=Mycolicibacterium gilvum TaxID=1804 RepID=UPI004045A14E